MSEITAQLRIQEADEGYHDFERQIATRIKNLKSPLFRTDAAPLFPIWLNNLPTNRQHYNCRCCESFIEKYGGLVTLDERGDVEPAIWPLDAPNFFRESVAILRARVCGSKVTGVFLNSEKVFGTPQSKKGWTHLSGENLNVFTHPLLTAEQREAELLEEFKLMKRTLAEYNHEQVEAAVRILQSEHFPGYEKGVKIAEWMLEMMTVIDGIKHSRLRDNVIWYRVATAPPGFTHLKNGMVGTLFTDIAEGKSFEECRRAWAEKMHPLQYRRPTAAPSEGQIDQAEKIIEKLGIAAALKRRYANVSDLKTIFWQPKAEETVTGAGVFDHLRRKAEVPNIQLPNMRMTWRKFERDVLPNTNRIEIMCPVDGNYIAHVTASDASAPPILQWDDAADRNPVSYYVYHGGSRAAMWNIRAGWNPVKALAWAPHRDLFKQHSNFVFFVIENCRDISANRIGLALFPESLRTELKSIDRTIEAFSSRGSLEGVGDANGLPFDDRISVQIRVNGNAIYTLDRWE